MMKPHRSSAMLVRSARGVQAPIRIACVILSIDQVNETMRWRRIRYRSTPPVPGDYEIFGRLETGYPAETATIWEYTTLNAMPAYAQKRHGDYLIEPNAKKKKTTGLFGLFDATGRHGMLAELDPETLKPIAGRVVETIHANVAGCGGGKNYLWVGDVGHGELHEYSTHTMALLRRFSIQRQISSANPHNSFTAIDGVDIVVTSVGGTDDLIYLFGRSTAFQEQNQRLLFIIDVVGPTRQLIVREKHEVHEILNEDPQTRYYGGGDEDILYVADGSGILHRLRANTFAKLSRRVVGGTIAGFGGNHRKCYTMNKDQSFPPRIRLRDPVSLRVLKGVTAPFTIPVGIGGDPD